MGFSFFIIFIGMKKIIITEEEKLNILNQHKLRESDNNFLKFRYDGNELPTPEMYEWVRNETEYMEDWDELDRDLQMDNVRNDFFDKFQEELRDLSYMEMLDVFYKCI